MDFTEEAFRDQRQGLDEAMDRQWGGSRLVRFEAGEGLFSVLRACESDDDSFVGGVSVNQNSL